MQSISSLYLNFLTALIFPISFSSFEDIAAAMRTDYALCKQSYVYGILFKFYSIYVFILFIVYSPTSFKVFCIDHYSYCLCRLTYLLKRAGSLMRLIHTQK